MKKFFPDVSPKQSFPELESNVLLYWKENDTFKKSIETRPENNPYRFYDGPPFITGTPHYGSLLSSVVKDVVGRYWTMRGKRVDRVWGWDCHGLPIEEKVQKKLGLSSNKEIEERGIKEFIDGCYEYTQTTSAEWDWYIDKIGRWVDMDRAYRTMDQDYMESVMWVFEQLWNKGLIYKGKRVSLYSWKLSTPISNFEVAMDDTYQEVNDPAITVKFYLEDENKFGGKTAILAWTTTPWTIPANMALALGKNLDYVLVKNNNEQFIVAKSRVENVFKGKGEYEIIKEFKGEELIGLNYKPPFNYFYKNQNNDKNHKIYHADFATDTDGTGIVHTAPEFGDVDYQLGKDLGLTISEALDNEGKYTNQINDYAGTHYLDANKINVERMKENGTLFKNESITHRIPFCPRSGTPLVQKAQDSWFVDIQSQKEKLLKANEKINWFPEYLKYGRFAKGIESAPDWCISRTRFWGCPMPVWISQDGKEQLVAASREKIFQLNKPYGQLTKIILIRHGRTDYNEAKKADSENKANLTELGKKQAQEIAKFFENTEIDAIYSSPFNRCIDTITPLSKGKNLNITTIENFQELQKKSWQDKEFDCSNLKWEDDIVGDETLPQAEDRIRKSFEKIIQENQGKTVVICTHGDPFVLMEKILLEGDYQKLKKKMPSNKGEIKDFVRTYYAFSDRARALNLHRPYIDEIKLQSPETGEKLTRIKEVLDVWMDSGSMPYAQMHYPFENKNPMEASFPADFIAEYVGQVRAWFYVMHVLGVLLGESIKNTTEPTPSFTNVITTGVINGNDGRKMSKSFGNYPDPRATIEKYGADPIRFYMLNSPLLSGGDMDFKEEGIIETIKTVMLPIWNTYSFFTTYANIDSWEPKNEKLNPINNLDKWIISKLQILIQKVHTSMEAYDVSRATRSIVEYMDELTNWYVRLSRRRFWGSEMTDDKNSAYQTLHYVLVEISKIIAPYMPFMAEDMFRGLTGKESVHLEYTTSPDLSLVSEKLNDDMQKTSQFVSLGLALRSRKNIRVRQPLSSITLPIKLDEYYEEIIKSELNVKEIFVESPENLAKKICKPDARKIGPKYGKDVQKIIVTAKNGDFVEIEGGKIKVGDFILESDEYNVEYIATDITADIEGGYGTVIAMNTNLSEDLILEGNARDIIRQIQDMRKEAGYQVTDKIYIHLAIHKNEAGAGNDVLKNICEGFEEAITKETLSTMSKFMNNPDLEKILTLDDGSEIIIQISK